MPTPSPSAKRTAKPRPKPAAPSAGAGPNWTARLCPDLSRGSLVQMAGRVACVCAVVGVMTVAAGWHSSGMVRRGEIQRMVRMSANMPPAAPEARNRGRLDKNRLEALAASAGR